MESAAELHELPVIREVPVSPHERELLGEMEEQLRLESRRVFADMLLALIRRYDQG